MSRFERLLEARGTAEGKVLSVLLSAALAFSLIGLSAFPRTAEAREGGAPALAAATVNFSNDEWQAPKSDRTKDFGLWCTNLKLGTGKLSTKDMPELASQEGMTPDEIIEALGKTAVTAEGKTYTFHHLQVLDQNQTINGKDEYNSSMAVERFRFNQSADNGKGLFEYRSAVKGDEWVATKGKYLSFYYRYNLVIGNGDGEGNGTVTLLSKDWPHTEQEWVNGAGASDPVCAVYQLYSEEGTPIGAPIRTYYYSPSKDKIDNSLVIGDYWTVEEVRVAPIPGKSPVKKQAFTDYTVPETLDAVGAEPVADPTDFTIPWETTWGMQHHACLIAVKVKAMPSEQSLDVHYLDSETHEPIAESKSYTAKKTSGTALPTWDDYVAINEDGMVVAKDGYEVADGPAAGVRVPTTLGGDPAAIAFALPEGVVGYEAAPHHAALAQNENGVLQSLNLYFGKQQFTVTYTDGVEGEEVFPDQATEAPYGSLTPSFAGDPAREGWEFAGWAPQVADTVTENATYAAQWQRPLRPQDSVVTAEGYEGVYDGASHSIVLAGLIEGDQVVYQQADGLWGDSLPTFTNVVDSATVRARVSNSLYRDAPAIVEATVTITPAPVTVKAEDKRIAVGEEMPALTATVTGMVNDEPERWIEYTLACEADGAEGTYPITVTARSEQGNYEVTTQDATLTIAPEATEPNDPQGPTDPENPQNPEDPQNPDDPDDPEGTPIDDDDNPTPPVTPAGPTNTPGPGTPAGGDGGAPAGGVVIPDDGTPLAMAADNGEETIVDEENPLGAFDLDPECWVHWLMIIGMVITVVYGAGVVLFRRKNSHDLDDFEKQVLGEEKEARRTAAANVGYQAI